MSFSHLRLAEPILKALSDQNYHTPTPIQMQAIPVVLNGQDLLASAQTGTGKTASFTLPILHRLSTLPRVGANKVRVLVLTPTRELAAQVQESIDKYGKYLTIRSAVVFGGVKINPQMMKLRGGVDILVATPGRLMDLHQQNAFSFDQVETLVIDEADRMLDMGFINDIKRIISRLPYKRQNLLFSATFSEEIRRLAKELLTKPVEIDVAPRNTTAVQVEQIVHPVDKAKKTALLSHLIREKAWFQALVFSRTKHGANKLVKALIQDDIEAIAIHGNKSQSQRTKALHDFKSGKIRILVATDIASRGIDINQLPLVVNFDLPQVAEDYVHRIGRTGRAGSLGCALSLVSADEFKQLQDIEKLIKCRINRVVIDDFEPQHSLPMGGNPQTAAIKKNIHRTSSVTNSRNKREKPSNQGKFSRQRSSTRQTTKTSKAF